jgi:hypothetical protein
LFATSAATAGTIINPLAEMDPSGFTSGGVADYVRGWRFQANADVFVTELGAVTPHSVGDPFTVVLWDFATQTQLATANFFGLGAPTWQWQDLASPVALTNGSQYIVSIFSAAGNYYFQSFSPGSPWLPTGTIEYLDMRYANSANVGTFPTNVLTNYQYGVPDIGYTTELEAGVPEPASLGLVGFGLLAICAVQVRNRTRTKA